MRIKKLLLPILALAIMVALGACSNEELMPDAKPDTTPHTGRTLSFTAAMPGEDVATRVGLTQEDDKTITLTWQADDELQLAFVQEGIKATNIATIASMTADKKKATFQIEIPEEIDLNAVFNLYGVYGAGVINITGTNPIVTLPTHPGNATSLADVQNRKDVMLSFQSLAVDVNGEPISVVFTHLGSLFSITLKNAVTWNLDFLQQAQIVGIDNADNLNWAYNSAEGGQTYDLVAGEFQNITSAGNSISFAANQNTIPAESTITFWAWYPPLPNKSWPKLQLKLNFGDDDGEFSKQSTNSLPARNAETAAGKSYYFYAAWDGTELNFTNESFTNELTIDVAEVGTLSTLMSVTQKFNTTKLTLTGQINKADYNVMKLEMPNLKVVDLSKVTSYDDETANKIPGAAFGDQNYSLANKTITTIIFPENVTIIGSGAFESCTGLTGDLIIPDNVTTIGSGAFIECGSFNGTLTLSAALETIGGSAFAHCFNFTGNLIIPDNVTTIGSGAFIECGSFNGTLTLPEGLQTIGDYAFAHCFNFTGNLIIPENVTTIGESAFSYCRGFNGTLTLPTQLETIESYAFSNCSTLVGNIFIPDKVMVIGDHAFDGCRDITSFQFPHTTPIAYTYNMLQDGKPVEVQASAVATYQGADGWNTHPIVPMFDEYAINVATKGTMSTLLTPLQKANIRKLTVTGQINKADYDVMKSQMPNLRVVDLGEVTSYEGETLNKIPDEAFEANFTITTITLPESVTVIGNYAFRNCEQLRGELILPNGLEIIGDGAFNYCPGFTGSLIIPDNVTTIGYGAFSTCFGFNGSLILPEGLKTIGFSAFDGCYGLSGSLILPKGLTTIGAYAFFRCNKITGTVTFPSTLTSIGTFGFFESNSIEAFQFPHTTPITYTSNMLPAGTTVEVPGSAVVLYLDNADWVPRHTISVYVDVEVEVPPL